VLEIDVLYSDEVSKTAKEAGSIQNESTLNMVFITDLHHQFGGNQLRAAKAVRDLAGKLPMDFILNGGDISVNGLKSDVVAAQKEMIAALQVQGVPLLSVKGNHDDNSIYEYEQGRRNLDHVLFPEDSFDLTLSGLQGVARFDPDYQRSLYYYMDLPDKKTRMIVLDCIDIPYTKQVNGQLTYLGQWQYAFSSKQLNWLVNQALNLQDKPNWNVLIASHVAITQEEIFGADHEVMNGEVLWKLITAFRDGRCYSSEGGEGDFRYQVKADFTEQGPRTVIACLFGHVHYDQVVYKDRIPVISTLNATTNRDFEVCPGRVRDTISETAFDLITVDFRQSMLYMHRFGAGESRKVVFNASSADST
jgi:hypothetical protein